ncbi:hypothetical protein TNCV_2500391 [Trichonephila clavipes]|nr:hypothetical protein TNCV_2500391 [Trichonephila clavipes]
MAPQTITSGVRPLWRSIMHSGMRRSPARIRPSWCHKLKRDLSEKTTCCQLARQLLCTLAQCSRRRRWFCVRGILHKGILARSPRCNRHLRIDEAHNETPVAVDHCAASCLEKAVRSV